MARGRLVAVRGGVAVGEVFRGLLGPRAFSVELLLDGELAAVGLARPSRRLACGFEIPLPDGARPGARLEARLAGGERLSGGCVLTPGMLTSDVKGGVDRVVGLSALGWAWAPEQPWRKLTITAHHAGEVVARCVASEFRGDLVAAGIGDGGYGFSLRLPLWFGDGVERDVEILADEAPLAGGRVRVRAFAEGPRSLLAELGRALPLESRPDLGAALDVLDAFLVEAQARMPASLPFDDYSSWRAFVGIGEPEPRTAGIERVALPGGDAALVITSEGATPLGGGIDALLRVLAEDHGDVAFGDVELETERGLQPWFKPAFGYQRYLVQDLMKGLVAIRESAVRSADRSSRETLEVAAIENAGAGRVVRVPSVVARLRGVQPGDGRRKRAIEAHLARRAPGARLTQEAPGAWRVRWPMPTPPPMVSIIVPTRDRLDLLGPCLRSIRERTTYASYEIIVVDNDSREPETLAFLEEGRRSGAFHVLRYDKPFNFSDMNNLAVARARGSVVAFVNNDVELITPGWLEEAVGLLSLPETGAVGARLRFRNGMIQHAGVVLGTGELAENAFQQFHVDDDGYFGMSRATGEFCAVTAACLLCRRSDFVAVGGFDAENLPVAFNDVDFCLRLRERGLSVVYSPHIELYHDESASRGRDDTPDRVARVDKEQAYMRTRWRHVLDDDPYYNPNLALDGRPFSGLALPPRTGPRRRAARPDAGAP
jgi:GT2 family glycosyltransferase